ncbi:hypothetical protein M8J76_004717 [Diaphorina citri]|nr:hypothetical protein M8J76_004717 [Diaphorina citri]
MEAQAPESIDIFVPKDTKLTTSKESKSSRPQLSLQLCSPPDGLKTAQFSGPHATFCLQRLELRRQNVVQNGASGPAY